jgi:hypothetical protein
VAWGRRVDRARQLRKIACLRHAVRACGGSTPAPSVELPPILLRWPPAVVRRWERPDLRGQRLARRAARWRFLIQPRGIGGAPAPFTQGTHHDLSHERRMTHGDPITHLQRPRSLGMFAIDVDFATANGISRCRPRLEKSGCPQPFIEARAAEIAWVVHPLVRLGVCVTYWSGLRHTNAAREYQEVPDGARPGHVHRCPKSMADASAAPPAELGKLLAPAWRRRELPATCTLGAPDSLLP